MAPAAGEYKAVRAGWIPRNVALFSKMILPLQEDGARKQGCILKRCIIKWQLVGTRTCEVIVSAFYINQITVMVRSAINTPNGDVS